MLAVPHEMVIAEEKPAGALASRDLRREYIDAQQRLIFTTTATNTQTRLSCCGCCSIDTESLNAIVDLKTGT